jgi:N6-L-threonylcarbamoyladenine synthase
MIFLAIETSCDETAVALFDENRRILASVVASQTDLHARFSGVVPEVAARAHLQRLLPTLDEALRQATNVFDEPPGLSRRETHSDCTVPVGINPTARQGKLALADVGCIVVLNTPGLVGALLVGVSAAKMLSLTLDVPLIAANHIEAHIYACRLAAERDIFPCVGLVVSGGHTSLFDCRSPLDFHLLGGTIDDAAGEAFDKVAALLGLGFPGGPAVEREAKLGDPKAFAFPRSFLRDERLEFSFSGLKTAVLYALHGPGNARGPLPGPGKLRADLAASFQAAVVDVLVGKCRQALVKTGANRLAVGGGVSANGAIRAGLAAMCERFQVELIVPPLSLCTDNAAMAAVAVERWLRHDFSTLDLDASPNYQPTKTKVER